MAAAPAPEASSVGWRPVAFAGLLALFVLRVAAQLIQAFAPTPALPAFEDWQGGDVPYPVLAAGQAAIIVAGLWAVWVMWTGRPEPQPRLGRVLVWIGWVYLVGAAFRFVGGLPFLGAAMFNAPLPGFFHILLACMVLLFAAHLSDEARKVSRA